MTDYTDLKRRLGEAIISQAHEDRRITSGPLAERLLYERMEAAAAIAALEAEVERYRGHVRELFRICKENEVHDMMLAAVAADLDALALTPQ